MHNSHLQQDPYLPLVIQPIVGIAVHVTLILGLKIGVKILLKRTSP
jgi:hypothetical protein